MFKTMVSKIDIPVKKLQSFLSRNLDFYVIKITFIISYAAQNQCSQTFWRLSPKCSKNESAMPSKK